MDFVKSNLAAQGFDAVYDINGRLFLCYVQTLCSMLNEKVVHHLKFHCNLIRIRATVLDSMSLAVLNGTFTSRLGLEEKEERRQKREKRRELRLNSYYDHPKQYYKSFKQLKNNNFT